MKRHVLTAAAAAFLASTTIVNSFDRGQWSDGAIAQWFKSLMQPDRPTISCCGEADAYWADKFETQGDQYAAIITDTRPDEPLGRQHVEPGTKIVIPHNKIKYDKGNPTGHGIVFLNLYGSVFCYLPPSGT
jgi:hypothetical protein